MVEDRSKTLPRSSPAFDKQFKTIIIGDSYCGKTSLLMRIGEGSSVTKGKTYEPTVGVDCRSRTFNHQTTN